MLNRFIPETSAFAFKRALLRWCGARVGKNVRICSSATILGNGDLEIGDDTWVGHQVLINSGSLIQIGANVDIAPRVVLGTGSHKLDPVGSHTAGEGTQSPIVIEDGVWLCANSLVLPGVRVGKKSVVAAGAVVTRDVPERQIVAGVPARLLRSLD